MEEKWRWDRTATPEQAAGGGEGFPHSEGSTHGEGISRDGVNPLGYRGSEINVTSISPTCSGPNEHAGVLGLDHRPPKAPLAI